MSLHLPVTYGCGVTLHNEEHDGYLQSIGPNEQPKVRVVGSEPLLGFENSVFSLIRESTLGRGEKQLCYGNQATVYNPVTKTAAMVLKTERSDGSVGMRVVMRPLDDKTSSFRVLPKFKVRSALNYVTHGDSVVLQLENSDLFLSVGDGKLGLEVVATGEPSTWVLNRYDRGVVFEASSVEAGRILVMQHRAHSTLLASGPAVVPANRKKQSRRHTLWQAPDKGEVLEGAVANTGVSSDALFVPTTDTYFTSASLDTNDAEMPSLALWICENTDPATGGPLVAGDRYRIRHFVTGRYMCIHSEGGAAQEYSIATIGEDDADMLERSLFDLESSAENEMGHLSEYHSYVRLKHVQTGQWLGNVYWHLLHGP